MKIILDTTEIVADPALKGVYFRLLREYVASSGSQVIIPEVVIQEARRCMREDVTKLIAELLGAVHKLRTRYVWEALDRAITEGLEIGDADDEMLEYTWYGDLEDAFERRLSDFGASVIPSPSVPHSLLVTAELRRRKPFDGKGRGYRDALIWCSVLEAARDGAETAFITSNKADFPAEPSGTPLDSLLEWFREAEVGPAQVRVFHGLEHFAQVHITPRLPKRWEKVTLEAGKHKMLDLRQVASDQLAAIHDAVEAILRREYSRVIAGSSVRWEGLDPPGVQVLDMRELSNERGLVVARLGYGDVVAGEGPIIIEEVQEAEVPVLWIIPRGMFEMGMEHPKYMEFSVRLAVVFNTRTGEVENAQVSDAEVRTDPSEWLAGW